MDIIKIRKNLKYLYSVFRNLSEDLDELTELAKRTEDYIKEWENELSCFDVFEGFWKEIKPQFVYLKSLKKDTVCLYCKKKLKKDFGAYYDKTTRQIYCSKCKKKLEEL